MRPVRILAQIANRSGKRIGHEVRDVAARKRVQKCFEVLLLLLGQLQGTNQRRQQLVGHAPAIVEVDDLAQGVEPAVVHVGSGQGDVAQRLGAELPAIVGALGDPVQAQVIGEPLLRHCVDRGLGSSANTPGASWTLVDSGFFSLTEAA